MFCQQFLNGLVMWGWQPNLELATPITEYAWTSAYPRVDPPSMNLPPKFSIDNKLLMTLPCMKVALFPAVSPLSPLSDATGAYASFPVVSLRPLPDGGHTTPQECLNQSATGLPVSYGVSVSWLAADQGQGQAVGVRLLLNRVELYRGPLTAVSLSVANLPTSSKSEFWLGYVYPGRILGLAYQVASFDPM